MKLLSLFAGIGGFDFAADRCGIKTITAAEIDSSARSVFQRHFPNTEVIHDVKDIVKTEANIVTAGWPCQGNSVAGRRGGLSDPRSGLWGEVRRILEANRPQWFFGENVPGLLSVNRGRDFRIILDDLEALGYIVDIEILDAEYFGVPQRRRRVFICGEHVESLLSQTSISSATTIAQCLIEILHGICDARFKQSGIEQANSELQSLSSDGAKRRMRLFGVAGESCNFQKLRRILKEAYQKYRHDVENSELRNGGSAKDATLDAQLTASLAESQSTATDQQLSEALDEAYEVMKSFITSTSTKTITNSEIYSCMQAVLRIGRLICLLRRLSPCSLQAGLSYLTALQDFTNYARQASASVFEQLDGVRSWLHILREAKELNHVVGCFGNWRRAAEILFERESVFGNSAKGSKARKEVAQAVAPCLRASGVGTERIGDTRGQDCVIATTLQAKDGRGAHSDVALVACTLPATDGGVSSGMHPIIFESKSTVPVSSSAVSPTVRSMSGKRLNGGGQIAVQSPSMGVRRLMPIECERLQGFPDHWTRYGYDGKEISDSARYRMIGNSVAVPCVEWILRRITQCEKL